MKFDISPSAAGHAPVLPASILDVYSFPGYEAKLIYVLLGLVDIVETVSGRTIRQKTDWSVLGAPVVRRTRGAIKRSLSAQSLAVANVDAYLLKNLRQAPFFEEFFDEVCRFHYASYAGNHVNAFLHIYRVLERISYAFPVAYAARSTDYKGTYTSLRGYLLSVTDGELAFFKKFLPDLVPAAVLGSAARLSFTAHPVGCKSIHYGTIRKFTAKVIIAESRVDWIDIPCSSLIDLLITIRNRYFHFMSGNPDNLTGRDVPDPNVLFEMLNPVFFNWIAYLYFRLVEAKA